MDWNCRFWKQVFLHMHINQVIWKADKSMFLEDDSEVCSQTPSLHSRAVLYFLLLFSFAISKYFLFLYSCRQFLTLAGIVILWNMCSTYLGSNDRKIPLEGQNASEVLLTARVSSARDSPRSHPWSFIAEYHLSSHCPSNPSAQGINNLLRVKSSTLVLLLLPGICP